MTPEIVTIALALVAGAPVALALDRDGRGARLLAESFLFGVGLIAVALLLLSFAGIDWSLVALIAVVTPLSVSAFIWWRRSSPRVELPHSGATVFGMASAIDALTIALVAGFALFATAAPVGEWDFWAIWGMKAKIFHSARGIDWSFLADPWRVYSHPDYPPLVPLVYDAGALVRGGWSDRWTGLFSVAWASAALLLVRSHVKLATGDSRVAALTTLAASGFALGPWIGVADTPLLAFAFGGCMLLREWLISGQPGAAHAGALLLGLGALTKNEGVALLASVAIALAIAPGGRRVRRLLVLWPGVLLAAIWQIPRLAAGLTTDLVNGAGARLSPSRLLVAADTIARQSSGHLLFSIGIAIAIVAGLRVVVQQERFLTCVLLAQFSFVLLSYAASPWQPLERHLEASWERVVAQTMPLVVVLAAAALTPRILTRERSNTPQSG